jgi:hypothetical protein
MGELWYMKKILKTTILAGALLSLGIAQAQTTLPAYRPHQTIRITVTFEGVDASKITGVQMLWDTPKAPEDQPSFATQIFPGNSNKVGDSFEVSFEVPENQASGEYTLTQIRAVFGSPSVTLLYSAPDIPLRKLTIHNTEKLEKPKVKDVKVVSVP